MKPRRMDFYTLTLLAAYALAMVVMMLDIFLWRAG
jgi:hypothetical protein